MTIEDIQEFIPTIWLDVLGGYPAFRRLRTGSGVKSTFKEHCLHYRDNGRIVIVTNNLSPKENKLHIEVQDKFIRVKADWNDYGMGLVAGLWETDFLVMKQGICLNGPTISEAAFLDHMSPTQTEVGLLLMGDPSLLGKLRRAKEALSKVLPLCDIFAYGEDVLNKEITDEERRIKTQYQGLVF